MISEEEYKKAKAIVEEYEDTKDGYYELMARKKQATLDKLSEHFKDKLQDHKSFFLYHKIYDALVYGVSSEEILFNLIGTIETQNQELKRLLELYVTPHTWIPPTEQ